MADNLAKDRQDYEDYKDYLAYQEYLKKTPPASPPVVDQAPSTPDARAALQGMGKRASLGLLPTLQAGAEKLTDTLLGKPGSDVDADLSKKGFVVPSPDSLADKRKQYVDYSNRLEAASPSYFKGGELAGSLASAGALGGGLQAGGLMKAAGSLEPVASALGGGALMGGLSSGENEFQTGQFNPKERVENAEEGAKSGLYALGASAALAPVAKSVASIPGKLKDAARTASFRALGPFKAQVKQVFNKDSADTLGASAKEIGQFALDNKIVSPGDKIDDIYFKANDIKSSIGKKIAEAYQKAIQTAESNGGSAVFSPKKIGQEFLEKSASELKGTAGGNQALKSVGNEVKNFMDNSDGMNIKDVHDFRVQLDDLIYDAKRNADTPAVNALKSFRKFLTDKITSHISDVDGAVGGTLGKDLRDLNKQYGMASDAAAIAKNRFIGEEAKSFLGLRDTGIGVGAGMAANSMGHDPMKAVPIAIGTGLLSKGVRTYGLPIAAKGLEVGGKVMGSPPVQGLLNSPNQIMQSLPPASIGALGGQYGLIRRDR